MNFMMNPRLLILFQKFVFRERCLSSENEAPDIALVEALGSAGESTSTRH